jgi:hypothetical protein
MIANEFQAMVSAVLFLDMNKVLRFNISLTQDSWMCLLLTNMPDNFVWDELVNLRIRVQGFVKPC